MNKGFKNVALVLLLIIIVLIMLHMWNSKNQPEAKVWPYSFFLTNVKKGRVKSNALDKVLKIRGQEIFGWFRDAPGKPDQRFRTYMPYVDPELIPYLRKHNIAWFTGDKPEEQIGFFKSLLAFLPWIILLGFIWFLMVRQIQSTGNKALSFGKSKAKLNPDMKHKVTFADVAGVKEAKEELSEIVDFLREPQKFRNIGAKIPRGVLLIGPPGTGKTLLAKAVSGEAAVPFFSISGSDFVEMFVGVGASRVRDLFTQAKRQVPCIIFIDEIHAVGRLRGAGLGGGHDEREQTLNQLLVEMDGFEENEGIIIIAATNRADVLDPALLRPGRFDRQVVVDSPDVKGREDILKIHSKTIPLSKEIDLTIVAKGTPGFTGADLANVINESALLAARRDSKIVEQLDLEEAKDKVMMGPERRSFFITEEEKEIIAYHEGGHALLSEILEYAEPIHKVTIIPRGRALGLTMHLPEEEKHMRSKNYWIDEIAVLLGGRLAEEIIFKDVTTGASNDIERATGIARKMVMEWGMSDKIGPLHMSGSDRDSVFIGRDYAKSSEHSEQLAKMIDEEVKMIIDNAFKRGRQLLKKHLKSLKAIARALLNQESITGEELRAILNGKTAAKPKPKSGGSASKNRKKTDKSKEGSTKSGIIPDLGVSPA